MEGCVRSANPPSCSNQSCLQNETVSPGFAWSCLQMSPNKDDPQLFWETSPCVIISFPAYEHLSRGYLQLLVVLLCQKSPKLLLSLVPSSHWLTAVLTHSLFVHNWPQPLDSTILALERPTWSYLQQYPPKKKAIIRITLPLNPTRESFCSC